MKSTLPSSRAFLSTLTLFFALFAAHNISAQQQESAAPSKSVQEISEPQYQSYMTVCREFRKVYVKDRMAPWNSLSAAMVNTLNEQHMTPAQSTAPGGSYLTRAPSCSWTPTMRDLK